MMGYGLRDAQLSKATALPASAGASDGASIDVGGSRLAGCDVLLTAPALSAEQLPVGATATYSIETSDTPGFETKRALIGSAIVQTGDGNVVSPSTFRMRLPRDCQRYIRATVVTGNGALDCSGATMVLELLM